MRWLFLLLLAFNIFYYVWSQQRVPAFAKDVPPFSLYLESDAGIQMLREGSSQSVIGNKCLYLGGLELQEEALLLEQRLLSLDIVSSVQAREVEAGVEYWVYFPPLSSAEAALRQLRELQARSIDSYLVAEGDLINALSLGLFSHHEMADTLLQRMLGMGYAVELRELARTQRTYWLLIAPQSERLLGRELMATLAKDFPLLQHQVSICENGVASP